MLAEIVTTPQPNNFLPYSSNGTDNWLRRSGFNADQPKSQNLTREIEDISSLYNVAVAAGSSLMSARQAVHNSPSCCP